MARNGLAHDEPYLWNERYMMFNGKMLQNIIWEEHNGAIPETYFVHHRNENKLDNRINNLELTTRAEHCRLHKPRLGTAAPPVIICVVCGQEKNERDIVTNPRRKMCNSCRGKRDRGLINVSFV